MLVYLSIISVCYLLALLLEVMRAWGRSVLSPDWTWRLTAVGLTVHTVHLVLRALQDSSVAPLSSWYDWYLMAGWLLAAATIGLEMRRNASSLGIFFLPLVLAAMGAAFFARDLAPFPLDSARPIWSIVHGGSLLMGTVVVALGFVAGIMYLVQSYRLKHKVAVQDGFRLPSLEWLQRINGRSLLVSTCLVGVGMLSGVVLNVIKNGSRENFPWSDPAVYSSAILFAWLLTANLFELFYKPARQGRKVAYLTLASFIFLGLVLAVVKFAPSQHAQDRLGSLTPSWQQATHTVSLASDADRLGGEA